MKFEEDILLIAGPTASGKTGLAIKCAQSNDALILNADSMQIYSDLRVLTARPSIEEERSAPHHLFGHRQGDEAYSVAHWLAEVEPFLARGRKLVIVGGTGLYFSSLLDGLSPVPEISAETRNKWRDAEHLTTEALHQQLDPASAIEIRPTDRQRIIRALEVFEGTGRSLVDWRKEEGVSILPPEMGIRKLLMMPERPLLHERINQRFDQMIDRGGLEEVKELRKQNYPETVSVLKAIGVPQLSQFLDGDCGLEEAIERSKAATRQYAKRQSTWFRNTFDDDWKIVE